ncbi:MAG: hypothetical protein CM1200mP2_01430 [Planctomycetaceae bacterium]|nr:MAG: hypothetical protein CM1200mP2_01430 [Planctomycetaceae bacterium]
MKLTTARSLIRGETPGPRFLPYTSPVAFTPLLVALFPVPVTAAELPSTVSKGATLVEVFSSAAFHEGPTWDPATGKLYFTAFFGGESRTSRSSGLMLPARAPSGWTRARVSTARGCRWRRFWGPGP